MGKGRAPRRYLVAAAAAVFGLLVSQVAAAGGESESDGPKARASAVSASKFKKLKKQVRALQRQVDALAAQPGPQGPPGPRGPAGTAPVCQGNGSGDTMVAAGAVCIDKYEVSVWSSPTGGTQYGGSSDDYPCADNGQDCTNIFARSIPGVTPSRFITWLQAQQALANVGKRLPSNAEWQQAAAGTPDDTGAATTPCATRGTFGSGPVNTGSAAGCVSHFGANDMVGNLFEYVADWVPFSTAAPGWSTFSDDLMALSGASTTQGPGVVYRDGCWSCGAQAGPLAVAGDNFPYDDASTVGFRGAR